jgi:hypothetical protein
MAKAKLRYGRVMRPVGIRLSNDLRMHLERVAVVQGKSLNLVCRELLQLGLSVGSVVLRPWPEN